MNFCEETNLILKEEGNWEWSRVEGMKKRPLVADGECCLWLKSDYFPFVYAI